MEQQITKPKWRAADMVSLVETNVVERMGFCSLRARVPYQHSPDLSWMATGIPYPSPFLNMIFRRMFGTGDVDTQIEQTLRRTRRADAPLFWAVHPSLRARELGHGLERHGLQPVDEVWGMAVPMAEVAQPAPTQPELKMVRVESHAQLVQWVQVLAHGRPRYDDGVLQWIDFEARLGLSAWSPWQRYLGLWEGQPVATAALFCAAESAGVYHVATLPSARGRGIGTAITGAALEEGRHRGYEAAVLIATEMGMPIYRRLGFQSLNPISVYMLHGQN